MSSSPACPLVAAATAAAMHEFLLQVEGSKRASEQLIYDLPELILVLDENGRILKGNQAAEGLFAVAAGALIRQPLAAAFAADSWQQFRAQMQRLHGPDKDGLIVEFDLASDGSAVLPHHYHWRLRRVAGLSQRRGLLFIAVAHDMTATHKLLAEIQASHKRLQERSSELELLLATIQSQKSQITEAAKLAQLGEMAGGIAHEINNPITIIKGHAEHIQQLLEKETGHGGQLKRSAAVIATTVDRIAAIVKSMRALARDGTNDPFEQGDFVPLMKEVLVFVREKFRAQAITLELECPSEPILTAYRTVQISQVFINLLNNARDAVAGQPKAWVRVAIIPRHDDKFEVRVSDSGPGIPEAIATKMMQAFFTTKPVGRGTGLGLSIARSIIQQHHGSLLLDRSSPHTCFVVTLPRLPA